MKKYIILTCLFNLTLLMYGQNRYNFNNRNTIGISSNFLYFDKNLMDFKFNQKEIVFQRVLTNRVSLIGSYGFAKNKSSYAFLNGPVFKLNVTDANGSNPQEVDVYYSGTAIVRNSSINMGVRTYLFRRGAIAPFGRYFEFKVGYATIKQKIEEDNFDYQFYYKSNFRSISKYDLPNYGIDHLNILSFQLGYGVSAPIVSNFYFDCMLNTSLNIALWNGNNLNSTGDFVHASVYQRDLWMMWNAKKLYNLNNFIKFNIGVHYGF